MTNIVPGQTLGAYRILNQIGEGGMAAVYRAYHAATDRHVAVKVLPSEFAKSESFRARFQQEARLVANLEHPHILPVHDFGESDGIHYFVMRFLQAGTLASRIEASPLPLAEIDRLFTQVADALGYAHQRGILHRDLKPANIMIDSRGDAFLTDFGIAKLLEGTSKFTTTGSITGTPAYMSPEQAQGEKLDLRSDIYSLGIVLYEMVTGRVPFDADTPLAVMLKHLNAPLPLPSVIKPDIHPEIERVLLKALAKSREERYGTAEEFIAGWKRAYLLVQSGSSSAAIPALQTAAASPRLTPPPASAPAVAPVPKKRTVGWPVMLGGAVLVALACLVVTVPLAGLAIARLLNNTNGIVPTLTGGTPLATLRPGETAGPVVVAPPLEGGTWDSWASGNTIFDLSIVDDYVFTAGRGSVNVWNRADGSLLNRYTTANGFPSAFVNTVLAEGPDSFWAATEDGLVHFEAEQARLFNTDDGLDSDFVTAVVYLPDGRLLVGTAYSSQEGGGLNVLDDGAWRRFENYPSADPGAAPDALSYNVIALLVDADERLWVGTDTGLGVFDGSEWTRYSTEDGLPHNMIWELSQDPSNGDILIGTEDGAARFDGSEFSVFPSAPPDRVYGVVTTGDGDYWLSGGGGLWRYNLASGDTEVFDQTNSAISSYGLYRAGIDDDGNYYFGSDDGLVVMREDTQFEVWRVPNTPEGTSFGGVLLAPDEKLWFQGAGNSDINIFDPATDEWLSNDSVNSLSGFPILFDSQGTLWANEWPSGLWRITPDGDSVRFGEPEGLPSETFIHVISIAPDGTFWLATNNGVYTFDGANFGPMITSAETGLPSDFIRTVLAAGDGSVWVSGESEMARRRPDGTWETLSENNPFDHFGVQVFDLAEDPQGGVWVATDDSGVFRFQNDAWTQFADGQLPSSTVYSIAFAPDTSVWVGTSDGAARFDGQAWQSFGVAPDSLIHSQVNDVLVTLNGDVYFATEGGISRLRP